MILAILWVHPARAAEVEYFAKYSHTSDLFRGCPFRCDDATEPQLDYLTPLGMTVTAGKNRAWEIDFSHGWKRINSREFEGGSEFEVRFYPGRLK